MADGRRQKLALVTTIWEWGSHANHMAERFLNGYPINGKWHRPAMDVAGVYVEQAGCDDLSHQKAAKYGFTIYPSISEALRLGGELISVDGVLLIGEHGDYGINSKGQKLYPRYEFFKEIN